MSTDEPPTETPNRFDVEAWLTEKVVEPEAKRLHGIAQSEIDRLVAAGYHRADAVLIVGASPKWPYAGEDTIPSGLLTGRSRN